MAQAVFSSPLSEGTQFPEKVETQSPETADANPDAPDYSEKRVKGKTVDLSKSPKKAPVVSTLRSTYPQPPHPYDYSKIEKFDEELYGEGN